MIISETQLALLTIQLATLGQTDLSANGIEELEEIEYLLDEALKNVQQALEEIRQ